MPAQSPFGIGVYKACLRGRKEKRKRKFGFLTRLLAGADDSYGGVVAVIDLDRGSVGLFS
jgi:hypothetical protein